MLVWLMVLRLLFFQGPMFPGPGLGSFVSYTGPGDVTTSAKSWWGLRAYSQAKAQAGVAAIQLCTAADALCTDIHVVAAGGLSAADITTSGCSGIDTCTIKFVYDQAGTACTGPIPCTFNQATIGNRPTFLRSCIGSLPCMVSATSLYTSGTSYTVALTQPYTMSEVVARTGSFTTQQGTIFLNGGGGDIEFAGSTNTALIYAGSVGNATAANTTTHAFNALFNAAASNFYIDGSANTVNAGSLGAGGGGGFFLLSAGGTNLTGKWFEAGVWAGDQSANFSAMNSNQHTYWGF